MTTVPLSLVFRAAAMAGRRSAIDGVTGGFMEVYTGLKPNYAEDEPGATRLALIPFALPCGTIASNADTYSVRLNFTVPITVSVDATGLAGWVRVTNDEGVAMFDVDAGVPGSGKPAILSELQLYAGGEVTLLSCYLNEA